MSRNPNQFLTPKEIKVEPITPFHAKVVLEPFERGFGHTLGNSLRRILLSSMPGCAVTDIQIEGVLHEYSTIEGVQEDVIDIMLNLKALAVKLHDKDSAVLTLNKKGPGVVTAQDFEVDHDVEIVNPNHIIAHLNDNGEINMKVTVKRGRGYEPASVRKFNDDEGEKIGVFQVDATFSPVKRVSCEVENARVEQRTDLDKLIINLETDGTLDPKEAISRCASILDQQLKPFVNLEKFISEEKDVDEQGVDEIFMSSIDVLDLTARAANCLRPDVRFIGDLVQKSETDLLKTPNLGKKSMNEIKQALTVHGLSLGMEIEGWPPIFLKRVYKAPNTKNEELVQQGQQQEQEQEGQESIAMPTDEE